MTNEIEKLGNSGNEPEGKNRTFINSVLIYSCKILNLEMIHTIAELKKPFILGLSILILLGASLTSNGESLKIGLSFQVKGITPQSASRIGTSNYNPAAKFPLWDSQIKAELKAFPNKVNFFVGEPITIFYASSERAYATIIDYGSDSKAKVLVLNRLLAKGFNYAFRGEITYPEGESYLRLLLASNPLDVKTIRHLAEFPLDNDKLVPEVIQEAWLRIVVEDPYRQDPYYHYIRGWQNFPISGAKYLFAQPFEGKVISYGISIENPSRVKSDIGTFEVIDYWEIPPGGYFEFSFNPSKLNYDINYFEDLHLLLFPVETPSDLLWFSQDSYDRPNVSFYLNGIPIEIKSQSIKFPKGMVNYEPIILNLNGFIHNGENTFRIDFDTKLGNSIRLRRIEVRGRLDSVIIDNSI